ncbi:MAG TPA: hypothetical protein DIT15_05750 [Arthrobacter bacterium]|nr:hypothetical protein [Arthrobacter sp.]HAP89686.1 hypothetical protein [Arthrobacter sp.]HBH58498.1 hypothetical protein [Arthrobacter sp.]HCB56704.1 hypothetical protein [Arthrobacter sp.]HCC41296.1 hypothetical protein [Arthrobacter sp.]
MAHGRVRDLEQNGASSPREQYAFSADIGKVPDHGSTIPERTCASGGAGPPATREQSCPWKGQASYHTLEVDGKLNVDAAWFYREPKTRAKSIEGRMAFWRGVTIEE